MVSSRGRYDYFDTSPSTFTLHFSLCSKITCRTFGQNYRIEQKILNFETYLNIIFMEICECMKQITKLKNFNSPYYNHFNMICI